MEIRNKIFVSSAVEIGNSIAMVESDLAKIYSVRIENLGLPNEYLLIIKLRDE